MGGLLIMANGGIIGPANDPVNLTVSAPGSAVTFTAGGTFNPFSAPADANDFRTADVLVIAGGRGGGTQGGGGGGGYYQFSPAASIPGSPAPMTIGGGGQGAPGPGDPAADNGAASTAGFSSPVAAPTGTFPPYQGDGTGTYGGIGPSAPSPPFTISGGGGAGADATHSPVGRGGQGKLSSPVDGATYRAGGGGGGAYPGQPGGPGRDGGGNGTGTLGGGGTSASSNTGSGGGGGGLNYGPGGNGGSGYIAILENDVNVQSASGVWRLTEQYQAQKAGNWPS